MSLRERDISELGARAARYLIIENDLPIGARIAAIASRILFSAAPVISVTCVR